MLVRVLLLTAALHVAAATVTASSLFPNGAVVSTVSSDKTLLDKPSGLVACAAAPGVLFIASTEKKILVKMDMSSYVLTPFAGGGSGGNTTEGFVDGIGSHALFNEPTGLTATSSILYVGDSNNHAIRAVTVPGSEVTTLAGKKGNNTCGFADGVGTEARFCKPSGVALSADQLILYVVDGGGRKSLDPVVYVKNNVIRAIVISTQNVSTIAGDPYEPDGGYIDGTGAIARLLTATPIKTGPGVPAARYFVSLTALAGTLYFTDLNEVLRNFTVGSTGIVSSIAGSRPTNSTNDPGPYADGVGSNARFATGLAVTIAGVVPATAGALISFDGYNAIRIVDIASATVTLLAGTPDDRGYADGTATSAKFREPGGALYRASDGTIFVSDTGGDKIRLISHASSSRSPSASPSVIASTSASASVSSSVSSWLTGSASVAASASVSASTSASATLSGSATWSATVSASVSPTSSASLSVSGSVQPSTSDSHTVTASDTTSATVTASLMASISVTSSASASASASGSASPSASASVSGSSSPSLSGAASVSSSVSSSTTPSVIASTSASASVSSSVSSWLTGSASVAASASVSASTSASATLSGSASVTAPGTISASVTATTTVSVTLTTTVSATPTPVLGFVQVALTLLAPAGAAPADYSATSLLYVTLALKCDLADIGGVPAARVTVTAAAPAATGLSVPALAMAQRNATLAGQAACEQLAALAPAANASAPTASGSLALATLTYQLAPLAFYSAAGSVTDDTSYTLNLVSARVAAAGSNSSTYSLSTRVWSTINAISAWITTFLIAEAPTTWGYSAVPLNALTSQQQLGLGIGIGVPLALIVFAVAVGACYINSRAVARSANRLNIKLHP